MSGHNKLIGTLLVGSAALANLFGCFPVTIVQKVIENPQLRVGENTTLRLQVINTPLRTPTFYYRAQRGRLVGMNGETGPQGGFVRAGAQVRYYAPFTSLYNGPGGQIQGDTIEILVQDGTQITRDYMPVTLTGSSVVFATNTPGTPAGQNSTLQIATASQGGLLTQPQPLKDLSGREIKGSSPVISPNGERIAYVYYPGDGTSKIMMRDSSGQILALTNNSRGLNLDPAWSPDGAFLLFAGNHETPDGTYEIYLENVDQISGGRAVTRLTNNSWDERHPAWNPIATGQMGMVPTQPTTSQPGVPTVSQTVSSQGVIAVAARKNTLQSPGGRAQNWNIFILDGQGNYVREISVLQGDGDNWAVEPSWRPDGNALAYTRFGPVNNFQSSAAKFQRIYVQEMQQSTSLAPLNVSNTDPNARESSPVWSIEQQNTLYFLRTDANSPQYARLYQTLYQSGSMGNTFQPQLLGAFQALSLPLTEVSGTNRDINGFHPYDWR